MGARAADKLFHFNWLQNPYTIASGLADHIRRGLKGESIVLWNFPFKTYSGDKSQYIHFRGVPLKGKDGTIEGLLCIIEDSTERVKAQAQLMQEAKMSAIGLLAAATAHELNNPLATLVAHSELACELIQGTTGPLSETDLSELREYMETVQKHAFRCKEIVGDLFGLLSKESNEEGETTVNALLDSIIDAKEEIGRKRRIWIKRYYNGDLPITGDDARALRRVFSNLIQNAIDATRATKNAEISVRTIFDQEGYIVEIEDNGAGIPDSIAHHIFEPFFTTKPSSKGMGMGLTICDDLIRKIGGSIEMEREHGGTVYSKGKSAPGFLGDKFAGSVFTGGSIFRVRLPVRKKVAR